MRALITGAQGFVGRYLTAELLRSDPAVEIIGTGRSPACTVCFTHQLSGQGRAPLPSSLREAFDSRYRYQQADLLDTGTMAELLAGYAPDCIFHMASGLRDDRAEDLVRSNVQGTTALISGVVLSGLRPRLVLGSSGGVYGRVAAERLPIAESTAPEPADVYAATKLAAEQIARITGREHSIPVVVARIFNIVGAGQDERHVCGRFARELHHLVRTGDTDLRVGALQTTRDFVDVRDVARALVILGQRGLADTVYNVGSGIETAIRTVLEDLVSISGYHGTWTASPGQSRHSDVARHYANITRLHALGYLPRHSLLSSLREVYAYHRDHDQAAEES